MARTCTICRHAERASIDQALVRGASLRDIAGRYGLSKSSVERHQAEHLPALLVKGQAAEEMTQADRLLAEVRHLQATAHRLLLAAEAAGDLRTALLGVREARGNLELLAKLTQQLDTRPALNLLVAPEWLTVRAVLLEALIAYPEARAAVVGRLAALEVG